MIAAAWHVCTLLTFNHGVVGSSPTALTNEINSFCTGKLIAVRTPHQTSSRGDPLPVQIHTSDCVNLA